jgi:hypothetical protein
MIIVQLIMLKVALDNRAPAGEKGGVGHQPFQGYAHNSPGHKGMLWDFLMEGRRPFGFWQWSATKPYVALPHRPIPQLTQRKQILHLPRLLHQRPLHNPRLPPLHLPHPILHLPARLRRPRHRSHPPRAADPQEPPRAIL